MINKKNIWNRILDRIDINKNINEINSEVLFNIVKNDKLNNLIYSTIENKFNSKVLKKFYPFIFSINNSVSFTLISKYFKKNNLVNYIRYSIKNHNNIIIKQEFITLYIENNTHLNINEIIYILSNYQIEQSEIDKIFKNNYSKDLNEIYNDSIDIEEYYEKIESFNQNNIRNFFKKKENLFYYFLMQSKLNDKLKLKLEFQYKIYLKIFILYSIKFNRYVLLKKYFIIFKYFDVDDLNELKDIIYIFFELLENKTKENNLNLFKVKKISKKTEQYYFLNKDYQDENDFDYYLENNLKSIDYYDFIEIDMVIELLETFVYEEDIDKIIFTFKILISKNLSDSDKKDLIDLLTHEYFYDINDRITVNFRKIFIDIFNTFDLELDMDIEEEYRLGRNVKYLYEKMYYSNINYKNIKYIMRSIKKIDLFSFLYNNDLIETFFKSSEIKKYDVEYLNKLIIKYNDKVNKEKIYYNDYEKAIIKYKIIGNMLENENVNKNYHFKFYKFYIHNNYLKKKLLQNRNLSIIVLYKSMDSIKNISYLIENKNLW